MSQKAVETKKEIAFSKAFGSFSVDDLEKAKGFYADTLGVAVTETAEGSLTLNFDEGNKLFLYPKADHRPATFTVLNFSVDDIDAAVDKLTGLGIEFESYGGDIKTDAKGIFRGADDNKGPNIAWFKDPAGNILSVIEGA